MALRRVALRRLLNNIFNLGRVCDDVILMLLSSDRSRGRRTASEGQEEAAALQVRVGGVKLSPSPSAAAQEPRRPAAPPGGQALPRRHQDHWQFPRRHEQQQTQPSPHAGVIVRPHRAQARGGAGTPRADGDVRQHRVVPPAEARAWLAGADEGPAEGSQLHGLHPPGGGRGELQPGIAVDEGLSGGTRPRPVQPVPPSNKVRTTCFEGRRHFPPL